MNHNQSPQQSFFSSPPKANIDSPLANFAVTPKQNITPSFRFGDSLFSTKSRAKAEGLLDISCKGGSGRKNFKERIKQQILGDLDKNERMIDIALKRDPPNKHDLVLESLPLNNSPEITVNDTNDIPSIKRRLFETETSQPFLDENCPKQPIVRKLFSTSEMAVEPIQIDEVKSPNVRERCLMNAEMLKDHFTFSLLIPLANKKLPTEQDNTNPFKEWSRLPSETDLECSFNRTDSMSGLMLDYSRSPLMMMRTNSRFEDLEDSLALCKKDSIHSVGSQESRFKAEFEVLGEIGKGHFGVIKRCKNRLDGLEYAVKITKHKWRGECGKLEALQEVFALSALSVCDDNPYIVKYFNGWVEDSKLYIVVSLCIKID